MCETTCPPCAAMSAVKTGMPALLASSMAGPMPFESAGQRMMASTFCTMKFSICDCCLARSISPAVMISW